MGGCRVWQSLNALTNSCCSHTVHALLALPALCSCTPLTALHSRCRQRTRTSITILSLFCVQLRTASMMSCIHGSSPGVKEGRRE